MDQLCLLEVIVCSLEDAIAAEKGGADRLEVISHYEVGGLTPSVELVKEIAATVNIPFRVMLRETEPFEVRDKKEIERLCVAAGIFSEIGVDGLVLGFLKDRAIDHELVGQILACAPNVKATFHRAFEELSAPLKTIQELKRHRQIDRILTSGGSESWANKAARFREWQQAAQPEINILVGGGTDAETIRLLQPVGINEFHVGKAVREEQRLNGTVLAAMVRNLSELVKKRIV